MISIRFTIISLVGANKYCCSSMELMKEFEKRKLHLNECWNLFLNSLLLESYSKLLCLLFAVGNVSEEH